MPWSTDDRRRAYRKLRRELVSRMGGRCFKCGYKWKLEFHHLTPRTWKCRKLNRLQRLRQYRKEFEMGVLVLACSSCNKRLGTPKSDSVEWVDEIEGDDIPF